MRGNWACPPDSGGGRTQVWAQSTIARCQRRDLREPQWRRHKCCRQCRRARSPRASASMATGDTGGAGHGKSASAARSASDADFAGALRPARGKRTRASATRGSGRRQCAAFSRKLPTLTCAVASPLLSSIRSRIPCRWGCDGSCWIAFRHVGRCRRRCRGGCASARSRRQARSPRASASMATGDTVEARHGEAASAARSACAKRRASDGTCPGTRPQSSALALHRRCRQCAAFSRKLSTATGAFASSPGWAISRFVMSVTAVGVAKGGCASARRRGRASSP